MSQHELFIVWKVSLLPHSACLYWSIWGWNKISESYCWFISCNVSSPSLRAMFSLFFNQIIQGRQNLSILIFIFVTEGLKKTKKKWQENELGLLQFQCSPCLSYSRATTLKIGVVIVYVCARLQCVCVFAQVPKTFGSVYNMCLCWEWMQVALENRAAPQLALLFI